jgi:poly(A) polymerase
MLEIKQKPRLHATWIARDATDIIIKLQKAGYQTYLVGGCVRDLLAGIHPKDYDIATAALPNEVRKKVWGSYIIGRRFKLVLAKRGEDQYEVATFRRGSRPEDFIDGEEQPFGDNFFGTPEEDALRRDFTINSMFYDPIKDELLDFAHGMKDIEAKILRMIGDPKTRVIEDPIRSLRAVRLSHKLKFTIESSFRAAILETAAEVAKSPLPRRREEYLKFMRLDDHVPALCELYDLNLMEHLLPTLYKLWQIPERRDLFIDYMHRMEELTWNDKNPMEIYLPIVLAYNLACEGDKELESKKENFLKDELGMFKSETAEVHYILELAHRLPDVTSFKKRGHRRQTSYLSQELLPFALRIARMQFTLSPNDLEFWESSVLQAQQNRPKR